MKPTDESQPFILSSPLLPIPTVPSQSNDQYPPITFNQTHRPFRDLTFSLLFLLLSLSTFSLGIFSSFHSLSKTSLSLSLSLSISSSNFLLNLIPTLLITLLLSFPIAFSLLTLLRHFAKHLVYISLPFVILVPIFLNIYWFLACQFSAACRGAFPLPYRVALLVVILFVVAAVGWILVSNWRRVGLTVEVLRIASAALGSNSLLLVVLPCLTVGLLAYAGVVVVFLVFAANDGKWRRDGWAPAYFALAIVTLLWSFGSMFEAKVYVTSGVIARWYFFVEEGGRPRGSLRSSLRNAFGPSFGTVCFSGMVLDAVQLVRAIVDSARREDISAGFVKPLLRCCADFLFVSFDFVNKFTINFAAITGESYCSSSKMTYELLRRNLLSAAFVETVSTRTLIGLIFVISTLYAIAY